MRLVEAFEEARQQELTRLHTGTRSLKRNLESLHQEAAAELKSGLEAVRSRPVTEIELAWKAQQQALLAKLDIALSTCAN